MSNVVKFTGITRLEVSPESVLSDAQEEGLTDVVVIGFDADGQFYFASSKPDAGDVLFFLERAKHLLMRTLDDMEEGA